jgi:hypothetical protein
MEPIEDDKFVAALESLRPTPRPAFVAELDEHATAGFPPRSRLSGSPLARFADRLNTVRPRRILIPAGATALAAVAAVTIVVAVGDDGSNDPSLVNLGSAPPAKPRAADSGVQHEALVPFSSTPSKAAESAASSGENLSGTAQAAEEVGRSNSGPYASRAAHREIERSAEMFLGADPAEVRKAASEVFETVHAYRGIVLSSSISDGAEGEAGARFELLIPSAKLGDALADFSRIAEVRSRHEATADITAPTVRTGEQLRDAQATIEGLLTQLSQAATEAERAAAEAQLRAERRHAAYLRAQLADLQRRANFSRVALRIETGATSPSNETGGWSIGDALGDAGHILAIAAGATIVGLAVIGPLAPIALLAWLANRARIRRGRRRALA